MPADELDLIKQNASLAIREIGPLSGIDFGLNRESVEWVEGYIERLRSHEDFGSNPTGHLVSVLGSFLGECIIAKAGGEWHFDDEHGWGIVFPNGDRANPINKVRSAFIGGVAGGDSILSFYDISVDYVSKGKLSEYFSRDEEG